MKKTAKPSEINKLMLSIPEEERTPMERLACKLIIKREELAYSMAEMGALFNVSSSTIANWEQANNDIQLKKLETIAEVFGVEFRAFVIELFGKDIQEEEKSFTDFEKVKNLLPLLDPDQLIEVITLCAKIVNNRLKVVKSKHQTQKDIIILKDKSDETNDPSENENLEENKYFSDNDYFEEDFNVTSN